MLGRTDSRARALLVLIGFVLVAGSLGVRLAYWQVGRHDELSAQAVRQSSMRYEIPSMRGSIYDRTGTVVLATSVDRDRLAAYPKLLTPERRAAVASRLVDDPRPRGRRRRRADDAHGVGARVRGPRARPRPGDLRADPHREHRRQPHARGAAARARAGPRLPAAGRRPGHDARRPRARLRQPRRRRPVRHRAALPGPARGHAARRGRAEGRGRQPRARLVDGPRRGLPGPGPDAHARRLAPGRRRAGAPRGVDRRPRQAGLGRRDGPLQRRGRRLRELPLVRRQRLPGDRRDDARAVRRPDRVDGLRARARCSRCSRRRRRSATGASRRRPA